MSKEDGESAPAPEDRKKEAAGGNPSPAAAAASASPSQRGDGAAGHPPNDQKYPPPGRAPEGYYQPVYPTQGEAGAPYPPPRGYEGGPPPYGMHPPMPGYPMYPYQPPMYPHYPGYPPPMYGYPPPDPNMYGRGGEHGYAKKGDDDSKADDGEGDEDGEDIVPGAVTARLKTYIKPRIPTTQDVLDRRARKNAQSRARAAKLRLRVIDIEKKQAEDRTEEEQQIFRQFENRRQRKNDRSRERALEKKEEIDRILAKPEKKRTKIEKQFLDNALSAKKRKNEGDRMRRQRLKSMGVPAKVGLKGAMARGVHIPPAGRHGYHPYPPPYGAHMGEIPMSPMPQIMGGHHPHMQSPGGFGSPGMMPGMGYPSPQHARRGPGGPPGAMETPGRPGPGGNMPYMPPSQSYEHQGSGSRVEQRRNADGSMSISIGGGSGGADNEGGNGSNNAGEEQSSMNISNVAHLLLYDEEEQGKGQDSANAEEENEKDEV